MGLRAKPKLTSWLRPPPCRPPLPDLCWSSPTFATRPNPSPDQRRRPARNVAKGKKPASELICQLCLRWAGFEQRPLERAWTLPPTHPSSSESLEGHRAAAGATRTNEHFVTGYRFSGFPPFGANTCTGAARRNGVRAL